MITHLNTKGAIRTILATNRFIRQDRLGSEVYSVLIARGRTPSSAHREISRALVARDWAVCRGYADPRSVDRDVLYPALLRMEEGETASQIFPEGWRGETLKRQRGQPIERRFPKRGRPLEV